MKKKRPKKKKCYFNYGQKKKTKVVRCVPNRASISRKSCLEKRKYPKQISMQLPSRVLEESSFTPSKLPRFFFFSQKFSKIKIKWPLSLCVCCVVCFCWCYGGSNERKSNWKHSHKKSIEKKRFQAKNKNEPFVFFFFLLIFYKNSISRCLGLKLIFPNSSLFLREKQRGSEELPFAFFLMLWCGERGRKKLGKKPHHQKKKFDVSKKEKKLCKKKKDGVVSTFWWLQCYCWTNDCLRRSVDDADLRLTRIPVFFFSMLFLWWGGQLSNCGVCVCVVVY